MRSKTILALLALGAGVLADHPARAEASAGDLRPFCAERPGRATPSCIVDPGHLLAEVSALDAVHDREGSAVTDALTVLSPHLRYGLTPNLEASVTFTPYVQAVTRDGASRTTAHGTGDTTLALKLSLRNPGGDGGSAALLPFVTAPTAQHGLGAGGFQGGLIAPIALPLPAGFSLALDPEIDIDRDGHGGTRPAYIGVVGLSHSLTAEVTGSLELWGSTMRTPAGQQRQATADLTLAWIPRGLRNLQLDLGANFGLTRATPDREIYLGVARRF